VFDYKITQLGRQDSHGGSILVDGTWYCPAMPEDLISASVSFRSGVIGEERYRQLVEARRPFAMRAKAAPGNDGAQRLMCPAAGEAPIAKCELKPKSLRSAAPGSKPIFVDDPHLRRQPAKVCKQDSVTFPFEAGLKYRQPLAHETPEWIAAIGTRSGIEGVNGSVKDGAKEALDDPERRRVRGTAATTLFGSMSLASMNVRRIQTFAAIGVVGDDGVIRAPAAGLERYRPAPGYAPSAAKAQ
jgi:hypothetical protein